MSAEIARAKHCIDMADRLSVSAELARIAENNPRRLRLENQATQYIELAELNMQAHEVLK